MKRPVRPPTPHPSGARPPALPQELVPGHVAIVMDGNGRWAQRQGKERAEGHAQGAHSVDVITEECCRLGLGQLTLFCLSSENWKRPKPEIDENERLTRGNTGLTLCLAINYGSRAEIVDAVQALATRVKRGELEPSAIDERAISAALYTGGMPDPDLLVRTAGEMRVSNYLLWQISYAELWVTQRFWPEFDPPLMHDALRDFARRERRFGGLT